jgi:hypothetical protein
MWAGRCGTCKIAPSVQLRRFAAACRDWDQGAQQLRRQQLVVRVCSASLVRDHRVTSKKPKKRAEERGNSLSLKGAICVDLGCFMLLRWMRA